MSEVYISTDIEADGPIPGENSMLSFGSAAFTEKDGMIGTFTRNLELLQGAHQNFFTMKWWSENNCAYRSTRENTVYPAEAMSSYVEWIRTLPGKPVFVGYPASYDFMFVYWYLIKFAGESPFSFSALDIKTYAMSKLGCGYREATKRNFPKKWFSKTKHTHVALDDAIGQGELFMNMLKDTK